MRIISSGHEKIARVNCACCGDDEHFADIFFNKELDEKDPDEYLFEFEFDSPDCVNPFPPLKRRIQEAFNLLKNEDNYRHDEYVDAIMVKPDQMIALYEVIREYADKVLSEEQKKEIDNPVKPEFKKWYIKFKKEVKHDWAEVSFFRSNDGLVLYLDNFESEDRPNELMLHDGGIGWFIPKNTPIEYIRRYAWNWIFKRSLTGMRHMYCSLTKVETVQFLAALNYIFTNAKKDEKGISWITIS